MQVEAVPDPRLRQDVAGLARVRLDLAAQLIDEHAQVFNLI